MSSSAKWKHLRLEQAVTLTSNTSNLTTPNNEQHINGQHSNTDYSYDIDFGQLHIASNLNTPQSTSNIISGSYDSISIPSNLNTPTISQHHTPCSNRSQVSNYNNSIHLHTISRSHTPSHSLSAASNSHSTASKSRSHSKSTANKRNKEQSPGQKFATEFYKKAKVKSVMRGNAIIGQFEAKLMLAYFRNVEVENIDSSDIALRYLESKSVRHLKRSLREMNETIRRSFYYGSDFTHIHEQTLLGNDNNNNNNESVSISLEPITENIALPSNIENIDSNNNNNNKRNNGCYVNLGDLTNDSYSSLDDYLQSPNTTYTPSTTADNINNNDEFIFNPLKGAQNVTLIKPKQPLKGFKKNFANKYFDGNNNNNNNNHNIEHKIDSKIDDESLPLQLPYIDESHSFWSDNDQNNNNNNNNNNNKRKSYQIKYGALIRQTSQTKMFGKFFDKRGSNISHGSIWSESESDDNDNNDDDDDDDDEDPYILTKFHSEESESMTLDTDIDTDFNPYPLKKTQSLDIPTPKTTSTATIKSNRSSNKPPNKAGKEHISQFSFASSVSLGSDYTSYEIEENGGIISHQNSTILPIDEDIEFEHNNNDEIDKLVETTSLNASLLQLKQCGSNKKKSIKNRKKYNKNKENKEEKSRNPHLLKIDSLLLNPENQPQPKHDLNYSLDSFLSDMEIPEPTAVEKLKYHLTEPRLPPSRRKTYNYSHI